MTPKKWWPKKLDPEKKSNFILLNKHKEPLGINGTRQKITIRTEREGIE